jgi:sugar phosphate isomerase/epimerase
MTTPLGIEFLSVFGLPPVEFVHLASDLGCRHISTGLTSFPCNPYGYEPFSLREDAALRQAMVAAMEERGISISLGEGFAVRAGEDVLALAADLDLMAELGVTRINTVGLDPDRSRCFDQFALLVELAAERQMETTIEFSPGLVVGDLDTALAAIHHVGRSSFRLLIDTMHFVRSGSGAAALSALDPELIGYVQLSDALLIPTCESYWEEAMFERLRPGQGELPLGEILAALPDGLVVGIEVPNRAEAESGMGPEERMRLCIEAARSLVTG